MYGGYCLPQDTKQLLASYDRVPQTLIQTIFSSNTLRNDFSENETIMRSPKTVGYYRPVMEKAPDNFRSTVIQGAIKRIKVEGVEVVGYESEFDSP